MKQDDGQVAGDRVAPKPRLPSEIIHHHGWLAAQNGIGIDHGGGQLAIELGIGLRGIDLAQQHLVMRPR